MTHPLAPASAFRSHFGDIGVTRCFINYLKHINQIDTSKADYSTRVPAPGEHSRKNASRWLGSGHRNRHRLRHDLHRYIPPSPLSLVIQAHALGNGAAVAYSRGPEWAEPKPLQHWPGKMINELANKVPSTLHYLTGTNIVKAWGFLCDHETEEVDVVDCFKLHLDPAFKDSRPNAPSLGQARQWLQDYLRCMHDYLAETFTDSFPRWKAQKTEFVFSVPTTWKNPGMIAETEKIIKAAGFGKDGSDHRAIIGLTEAEAAAVYASKQQYEKDDVVLVCDAGGGTTDVNVLRLTSGKGAATRLQQMSWVEGRPVGSTSIDIAFHEIITRRLDKIQDHLKDDVDIVADEMMQSRFERFKCSYGSAVANSIPNLLLEVPGLEPGTNFLDAGIDNSSMAFSRCVAHTRLLQLLTRVVGKT